MGKGIWPGLNAQNRRVYFANLGIRPVHMNYLLARVGVAEQRVAIG